VLSNVSPKKINGNQTASEIREVCKSNAEICVKYFIQVEDT
jgi:hypothetical protein